MSATLASQRERTARIARLNDRARQAMGLTCTAFVTVGFRSLPDADQSRVRELIETYDAFDEDSDPHGERERVFWKLDYYDRDLRFGSEDPANPAVTRRVLTIMLSDEY